MFVYLKSALKTHLKPYLISKYHTEHTLPMCPQPPLHAVHPGAPCAHNRHYMPFTQAHHAPTTATTCRSPTNHPNLSAVCVYCLSAVCVYCLSAVCVCCLSAVCVYCLSAVCVYCLSAVCVCCLSAVLWRLWAHGAPG